MTKFACPSLAVFPEPGPGGGGGLGVFIFSFEVAEVSLSGEFLLLIQLSTRTHICNKHNIFWKALTFE